jgi:trans-2,3-dihydro-3-hydroxyanthranilate isomerase
MAQPVPRISAIADPAPLLTALGVTPSELPIERFDSGLPHVYVALESEAVVAALAPDFGALARASRALPKPIIGVNCVAGSGRCWKTRLFAPAGGVVEDPVTGSAAGPLACWLARHGRIAWGDEIEIAQGAEIDRPSTLYARADGGGGGIDRVEVGGAVVVVGHGGFEVDVVNSPK